jgi:hypothetical protein
MPKAANNADRWRGTKLAAPFHKRAQRLLKGCVRQMDFGKDAGHAQHRDTAFTGLMLGHFEERRFPDPRLAGDNECRSAPIDPLDQSIDQGDVLLSALQYVERRSGGPRAPLPQPQVGFFPPLGHPTTIEDAASLSLAEPELRHPTMRRGPGQDQIRHKLQRQAVVGQASRAVEAEEFGA